MLNNKISNRISLIKTILLSSVFCMGNVFAESSPVGCWKTKDDKTGADKSYVKIIQTTKEVDGEKVAVLSANVSKILKLDNPKEDPETKVCEVCEGLKHGKPIKGMEIMWDVTKTGENTWDNGEILDPKTGKVYNVSLELAKADKLNVRGYIGVSLLGRTQTWRKVQDSKCNP